MAASFINQLIQSSVVINRSTGKLSKNQMENQKKIHPSIPANYLVWINFPTGLCVPPRPIYCVVNFRTGYIPHGNRPNCFPPHSKTLLKSIVLASNYQISLTLKTLGKNRYICIDFFSSHFGINFRRVQNNSLLKRMVCNLYYDVVTYGIFSDIVQNFFIDRHLFWV